LILLWLLLQKVSAWHAYTEPHILGFFWGYGCWGLDSGLHAC
jgi:hypothetical protein